MEFGNIGNYYIIEPFIRELHRVFPQAEIRTTFQMSHDFCKREVVTVLPMEYYYSWKPEDTDDALIELASASIYNKTGYLPKSTPFIREILESDLIIDFSGDIWGDNADFLGDNRFLVGLIKDRVSQLLNKPTVMLAGSPGPFNNQNTQNFAKEVFENFDLVTTREPISEMLLREERFDTSKTRSFACPAFLFEAANDDAIDEIFVTEGISKENNTLIGFILCGWNFTQGPFDKWPRDDTEYLCFAEAIEHISLNYDADILLMSHSNGFAVPPNDFQLIHGRDYPIIKQLQDILQRRGIAKNVFSIDGVYDAWTTKMIISKLDMLISGRIHGAVAGLSQFVPTVIIDYGHAPKAHKIRGFARVAGVEEYVADPSVKNDLIIKFETCWNNKESLRKDLGERIPLVKIQSKANFTALKELMV